MAALAGWLSGHTLDGVSSMNRYSRNVVWSEERCPPLFSFRWLVIAFTCSTRVYSAPTPARCSPGAGGDMVSSQICFLLSERNWVLIVPVYDCTLRWCSGGKVPIDCCETPSANEVDLGLVGRQGRFPQQVSEQSLKMNQWTGANSQRQSRVGSVV